MTKFKNYSCNSAFTLAEVLVTLGIIGVVSAMTVPSLMQNHQRKTYVTQLHKFYNEMSQALLQYQTDKNAVNLKEAGLVSDDKIGEFIKNYFRVANDCGTDSSPCMSGEYKKMNGAVVSTNLNRYVTLASGASLGYAYKSAGLANILFSIDFDINGQKGPNIVGRDIFAVYVYENGIIDDYGSSAPLSKDDRETIFEAACNGNDSANWYGCFGKILNDNWEMTY